MKKIVFFLVFILLFCVGSVGAFHCIALDPVLWCKEYRSMIYKGSLDDFLEISNKRLLNLLEISRGRYSCCYWRYECEDGKKSRKFLGITIRVFEEKAKDRSSPRKIIAVILFDRLGRIMEAYNYRGERVDLPYVK